MRHPVKTPPFRSAQGEVLPDSIAEVGYHRLGGVDQWVMIRGEHIANPALIILHGGPGLSEMGFFRYYNAPLEKCFTVIHWDQRGAGKSFDRSIPRSSMTVEQFITDLDQLVELLRQRLGTQRVVLFGHSWGSALGVLYAARFSEKVAAYIGCGQIGDAQAGEMASYVFALAEAERLHDSTAAQSLRAIGPPPHTADKLWVERRCLARLEGGASPWALLRMILRVPESSLFELPSTYRGFRFSLDAMWAEVSKLNLLEAAPALQMPVFFLLGRHDHWVPSQTSARYFDVLRAPVKRLVWFEESGHEPFVDEPAKFNATMVEFVRPTLA